MPRIDVLTLFPRMLDGFLAESILGKGLERALLAVVVHDLRRWTTDKHRTADDRPFGGGAGMVLKPEPVFAAIEELQTQGCMRIYLTPDGVPLTPAIADRLSRERHLILLSGHYEGVDQRIRDRAIDFELSIGDYVLTNGTLAAAVVIDALSRFIPGVLGEEKSLTHESFTGKLLDFPQYTRPAEFRGMSVPEVLLSGNHAEIEKWRAARALEKTRRVRPDLLKYLSIKYKQGCSHEPNHQGNHREPGEEGHPAVQGRRRRARAHEGEGGRQGADPGLFRHRDRAQGLWDPRDIHRPPDQLRRGRRARVPREFAEHRGNRDRSRLRADEGEAVLPAQAHRQGCCGR